MPPIPEGRWLRSRKLGHAARRAARVLVRESPTHEGEARTLAGSRPSGHLRRRPQLKTQQLCAELGDLPFRREPRRAFLLELRLTQQQLAMEIRDPVVNGQDARPPL